MSRDIDDRKKKKALRRLQRVRDALAAAEADGDVEAAEAARAQLSEWEDGFLGSVEERLNTFGSAFADPEKGALDEPLSRLQAAKLKELEDKAKGKETRPWKRSSFKQKPGKGFSSKRPAPRANVRDINEDVPEPPQPAPEPPASTDAAPAPRARFQVIKGGKDG